MAADDDGIAGPAEYVQLTPLVDGSEALLALAQQLAAEHAHSAHLAEAFMRAVHARMRYELGVTGVSTSASQAFALGGGVCQDYAHVMIALCRLRGLPARYVSGYLPAEGVMHAWAEVLVADPATGRDLWVAYDPTHARRADESYITVAIGRDYADVTPSSGFYTGSAANTLNVKVTAKVESRQPLARGVGTAPLVLPGAELRVGQEAQQQQQQQRE
jgi:transglutaminase-like putative cysteine protease